MLSRLDRVAYRTQQYSMLLGATVLQEDSAQVADSPALGGVLANFPTEFHEPFYADYLEDELGTLFTEAGFAPVAVEPVLVAKVVTARRPHGGAA